MHFLDYPEQNPDVNKSKEAQGHYRKSFCKKLASSQLRKTKQPPGWGRSPLWEHQGKKKGKYRGSYKAIMMREANLNYLTPVAWGPWRKFGHFTFVNAPKEVTDFFLKHCILCFWVFLLIHLLATSMETKVYSSSLGKDY